MYARAEIGISGPGFGVFLGVIVLVMEILRAMVGSWN